MGTKRVYFVDGFSPRKGLLGVASYLYELEDQDVEFTRFYMTLDGEWRQREFNEDIVSVSYTRKGDDWSWWLLSKRGKVLSLTPQGDFTATIPDAGTGPGKLGYLSQIKVIDGELYACGLRRQMYKRKRDQWVHMDDSMISEETTFGLRAMDGTAANNIHAVGYLGEIWYYEGSGWLQGASPTNLTLEAIRFISPDICYICGTSGVVLRGYRNEWEVIDNENINDLWGVEVFQNQVYLTGDKGLFKIDDDKVKPLDLGRNVRGYRLHSNGEELWSIEEEEIWIFDGRNWREIICLDNV